MYNTNDISWLHHLGRREPSHIACQHQAGISQQYERRCCPHATSHVCSHSRQWHEELSCPLFPKDHTTMSSTQSCTDFSSVLFFRGRRCQELLREPRSADISTGQQGCCAEVVTPTPDCRHCWVNPVSLAHEARVEEAPQDAFAVFVLLFLRERAPSYAKAAAIVC